MPRITLVVDEETYEKWKRMKRWQKKFVKSVFSATVNSVTSGMLQVNVIKQIVTIRKEDRIVRQVASMLYELLAVIRSASTKNEIEEHVRTILRTLRVR